MTDREKAIVMARTGICMLTGNKFQIFHKYIEDLMGRPVFIHELGNRTIEKEIKEKADADFIALCMENNDTEKTEKWIPAVEKRPPAEEVVLCTDGKEVYIGWIPVIGSAWRVDTECEYFKDDIIAWMPLPEPYKTKE